MDAISRIDARQTGDRGGAGEQSMEMRHRPCERCVHSIPVAFSGLHCGRSGGKFRCADERALGWLAAIGYVACGARGRFFAERPDGPGATPGPARG
jgi:hypothetical protein